MSVSADNVQTTGPIVLVPSTANQLVAQFLTTAMGLPAGQTAGQALVLGAGIAAEASALAEGVADPTVVAQVVADAAVAANP